MLGQKFNWEAIGALLVSGRSRRYELLYPKTCFNINKFSILPHLIPHNTAKPGPLRNCTLRPFLQSFLVGTNNTSISQSSNNSGAKETTTYNNPQFLKEGESTLSVGTAYSQSSAGYKAKTRKIFGKSVTPRRQNPENEDDVVFDKNQKRRHREGDSRSNVKSEGNYGLGSDMIDDQSGIYNGPSMYFVGGAEDVVAGGRETAFGDDGEGDALDGDEFGKNSLPKYSLLRAENFNNKNPTVQNDLITINNNNGNKAHNSNNHNNHHYQHHSVTNKEETPFEATTPTAMELECVAGYDGGLPQFFMLEAYDSRTKKLRLNITSAFPEFPLFRIDMDGE